MKVRVSVAAVMAMLVGSVMLVHYASAWYSGRHTHLSRWRRADLVTRLDPPPNEILGYVLVEFADFNDGRSRAEEPAIQRVLEFGAARVTLIRYCVTNIKPPPATDLNVVADALLRQRDAGPFTAAICAPGADLTNSGVRGILLSLGRQQSRPILGALSQQVQERPMQFQVDFARLNRDIAGFAADRLRGDTLLARRLGVTQYPSEFLCCPDGDCYRLKDLHDAISIIGQVPHAD